MNALYIVKHAARTLGLEEPVTLSDKSNEIAQQLLAQLNRTLEEVVHEYDWQQLVRYVMIAITDAAVHLNLRQILPDDDFGWFVTEYIYDMTNNKRIQNISFDNYESSMLYGGTSNGFLYNEGIIEFLPNLQIGTNISFFYKTNKPVIRKVLIDFPQQLPDFPEKYKDDTNFNRTIADGGESITNISQHLFHSRSLSSSRGGSFTNKCDEGEEDESIDSSTRVKIKKHKGVPSKRQPFPSALPPAPPPAPPSFLPRDKHFRLDLDKCGIDSGLLLRGTLWKYKSENGIDYAESYRDYRSYLNKLKDADSMRRRIRSSGNSFGEDTGHFIFNLPRVEQHRDGAN